ncbi:ABC transporter [Spirochaetia bacterium]|nr:ABC transporter [Spirochaetia bacterium]
MAQEILIIRGFSKTYGKPGKVKKGKAPPAVQPKKAVENLSLTVEAGDIFGFIGHNGAGKTTTIRAAAGTLDFDEGEILIAGHSVKREGELCKSLTAYIPDNPDIYEYLTGIQYLNFIADIWGLSAAERREGISRYAAIFELTANLGDLISSYSHGMKQKLTLISAFFHKPRLLILDEPFVGLDPQAAFRLKELMKDFCAAGGAVFFSTHVLEVAEKLCNKIGIIKDGVLMASGNTADVRGEKSLEKVFLDMLNPDLAAAGELSR